MAQRIQSLSADLFARVRAGEVDIVYPENGGRPRSPQLSELGKLTREEVQFLESFRGKNGSCLATSTLQSAKPGCEGAEEFSPRVLSCEPDVPELPDPTEIMDRVCDLIDSSRVLVPQVPPQLVLVSELVRELPPIELLERKAPAMNFMVITDIPAPESKNLVIATSDDSPTRKVSSTGPTKRNFDSYPEGSRPWVRQSRSLLFMAALSGKALAAAGSSDSCSFNLARPSHHAIGGPSSFYDRINCRWY